MKFQDILIKEPRLVDLIKDAFDYAEKNESYWDRNKYWYHSLKPRMVKLVGFDADNIGLRTTQAYDKIYGFFTKLLDY